MPDALAMPDALRLQPSYDERLAKRVTDGEPRPRRAALELFERNDPRTLEEAIALVWPDGKAPAERCGALVRAWDLYRHVRDMPCA
jgi:hypothetical protein